MAVKRLLIILALCPVLVVGAAETVSFPISFEKGYNARDLPEQMEFGYYTGNSYNFDPYPDGTARKRSGIVADTIGLAAAGISVNLLAEIQGGQGGSQFGKTLAICGAYWYRRANADNTVPGLSEGEYEQLTSIDGLYTQGNDYLKATLFNGRMIVSGDASSLAQFDGDSLYRLMLPAPPQASQSCSTLAGGSLDSNVTYYYATTFANVYGLPDGSTEESYSSDPISATTTGANRSVRLYGLEKYPEYMASGRDTTLIGSRRVYRGTEEAHLHYLHSISNNIATTWVDSSQYSVDNTREAPPQRRVFTTARCTEEYNALLWTVGPNDAQRTPWRLNEAISNPEIDALWRVHPATLNDGMYYYFGSGINLGAAVHAGSNSTLSLAGAQLITRGVRPGMWLAHGWAFSSDYAYPIVAVPDEETVVVRDPDDHLASGGASTVVSIGNNIFKVDDEVFAATYSAGNLLGVPENARGLFGTSAATHTANTPISVFTGPTESEYLYYSERYNPSVQVNLGVSPSPIGIGVGGGGGIAGLVNAIASLMVFKEHAIFQLTGTGEDSYPFSVVPVHTDIGCIARRSLVPYRGGALTLDESGLFWVNTSGEDQWLSEILSTAIADSAATNYYDDAAGVMHRDKYYLSVVDDGTTKDCNVWVYDFRRGAWTRYTGWVPHVWGKWSEESDETTQLYFGDWRKGNVYQVDDSATTDVDSAGTSTDIEAQLITAAVPPPSQYDPRYIIAWDRAYLRFDTNDSVRVTATIAQRSQVVSFVADSLSPVAGDSSAEAGKAFPRSINLKGVRGSSCQLRIWTSGDGRCTVYPGRIYGSLVPY